MRKAVVFFRRMVYRVLARIGNRLKPGNKQIVICYHDIGTGKSKYSVSIGNFQEQMKWLSGRGNYLVTFDDGDTGIMKVSAILEKYRIKPIIFICSSEVNHQLIKHALGHGWTIGSHGVSHIDLTSLDRDSLARQLNQSKIDLEKITGKAVEYLAYPYGKFNPNVEAAVKTAGYRAAYAVNSYPGSKRFSQPRSIVTGDMDLAEFEDSLSLPAFFWRWLMFSLLNILRKE